MSRSYKKHPGYYITTLNHCIRGKEKRRYNREIRRINKLKIKLQDFLTLINKPREYIDLYYLAQDGSYRVIKNKDYCWWEPYYKIKIK